mmetsp:Transcript_26808/g.47464  ORF Transcript_26808/g.47464 Transcript_26808/m.47464 type:complete len:155 (+) Transcript_26808:151-615(+)
MLEPVYEIERIIDIKRNNNKVLYLVKWKGYGLSHNSWEPASHFEAGLDELLQEFKKTKMKSPKNKTPRKAKAKTPSSKKKSSRKSKSTSSKKTRGSKRKAATPNSSSKNKTMKTKKEDDTSASPLDSSASNMLAAGVAGDGGNSGYIASLCVVS